MKFPITAKIVALFLALLIPLIFILSFVDYTESKNFLRRKLFGDMTAIANAKVSHIETLIEEDFEDAYDIATRVLIREGLAAIEKGAQDPERYRQRMLQTIRAAQDATGHTILNVDIIALDGKVAMSTVPANIGKNVSGEPYFEKGRTKTGYLSDPYPGDEAFIYFMVVPIYDSMSADKTLIGMTKVEMDGIRLCKVLMDRSGLGDTGEIVLGKHEGDKIIFFGASCMPKRESGLPMTIAVNSKYAVPMQLAAEKKSGVTIGLDYKGAEVLAAYKYIPISNWGLVAKIDTIEAFAPIHSLFKRVIIVGMLLFFLSVLAIANFARLISGPLKKLRDGMKDIARGDLSRRVDIHTNDEIGSLADSFNEMTENLQKITVSHDRLNTEVEDRKRAEMRLAQALRAKSDFTAMVSHELRTPLAAIKEGINIIVDGITGDINKEQKEYLNIARTNVDRLTRLINDILDFQKLESGKMELKFLEDDIGKAVREVYDTMVTLTEKKGIGFSVKIEDGLPRIRFDHDRIVQVLTNLVNNAIKFTREGSIAIVAVKEKGAVHVMVRDSGAGIRHKDIPRLFQSFEQLEEAIERKGGTGLGLAISKEIIERHRGRIWAESEFGKGTTMHFILPIEEG